MFNLEILELQQGILIDLSQILLVNRVDFLLDSLPILVGVIKVWLFFNILNQFSIELEDLLNPTASFDFYDSFGTMKLLQIVGNDCILKPF